MSSTNEGFLKKKTNSTDFVYLRRVQRELFFVTHP